MPKRFETCVLHIGTEKTGTTTLQAFLSANRAKLAAQGFFVPKSLSPYQAIANHERLTTFSLRATKLGDDLRRSAGLDTVDDVLSHRIEVRAALLAELGQSPLPRNLLLSNEHCHSRLTAIDEVETLRDFIGEFAETVQVIVYLRPQHQLAISLYHQALRAGYYDINMLPDFSVDERRWVERRYFDYWELLSRWGTVFGRPAIFPHVFDVGRLANGSIIDDFMRALGVTDEAFVRPKDRNTGLAARVQPALNAWNRYLKSGAAEVAPRVKARAVALFEKLSSGEGAQPARSAAMAFFEQFSLGNELVRRGYFPDRATLFDVDFSQYAESPAQPASETECLLDVLAAILADSSVIKV